MPEITELLEHAAPGAGGPAPLDDIVRRGRRRQVAARAAAVGAPLAVVAVVVAVLMTGGSPSGVVIDPPPPMAETPDPDPTPQPTEPGEAGEPTPGTGEEAPAVDTSGWVLPSGMAADVLVVQADGGTPTVTRLGADGSQGGFDLEDGVPNEAGLVPDRLGGFTWQPDWQSADPAPVLQRNAEGAVMILDEGNEGPTRLVGGDLGLDRPLVVRREGSTPEDTTGDLLAISGGGTGTGVTLVREGVDAWETGVSHAAVMEIAIYAQYVEAMHNVVIDPPDGDPVVVFEGGELNGEYPRGVGFADSTGQAVALVERGTAFGDEPFARLLIIDPVAAEVVEEIEVPLGLGLAEGATLDLLPRTPDVSVHGDHVLVNRRTDGTWLPPIVYDLDDGDWSLLEHRDGGPVTGRAFLAAPVSRGAAPAAAPCATEDEAFRMAPPNEPSGAIWQWVPCVDGPTPDVYRVAAFEPRRATIEESLTAALERLVELPLADEHLERGYVSPRMDQTIVLNGVKYDDGHVVVDLGYPDGAGPLGTTSGGSVWHHALLGATMQFSAVETVGLRLDGSCVDHQVLFEGSPDACQIFDRSAAPWNLGR
ncbi:MAG: hypothetical protein KG028_14810 [Actinobacteria bacterium]|jgi:hypothetical protein|nr:hypothetical protein [Actinomycetota bacterium]